MNEALEVKIELLPESPGCYLMKSHGQIIYVGKAANLANRVRSYFHSPRTQTRKVRAMVRKIDDFDVMLVDGEFEALVLENTLIKAHKPHYNILLKDDKQHPYIRMDLQQDFPRAELVRRVEGDKAKYFGPYPSATAVREALDMLRDVLPMRTCSKALTEGEAKGRPCIQKEIGRCLAPCQGNVTKETYRALVAKVREFLEGRYEPIVRMFELGMAAAAKDWQFERAAMLKEKLRAVDSMMQKQIVCMPEGGQWDVLNSVKEGPDAYVTLMQVREGRLIASEGFALSGSGDDEQGEVISGFIAQYYQPGMVIPKEILLPCTLPDMDMIEKWLSDMRGSKVTLRVPQRADKKRMVDMAKKNASDAAEKRERQSAIMDARTFGAVKELKEALNLDKPPRRIEAYDISHTQGVLTVASMVVMIDGTCEPKEYRRFKINTVEGIDDFASMREVISRRLKRGISEAGASSGFGALPDAILIDGGVGQLNAALMVRHELGVDNIPMFGLAKRLEEIFLPDNKVPILLKRGSNALHMVQRLRDEAHRFAITYHRKLRAQRAVRTQLMDIPGVGEKRRNSLLKHFKTVELLKTASIDELKAAPGMTEASAKAVYAFFRTSKDAADGI